MKLIRYISLCLFVAVLSSCGGETTTPGQLQALIDEAQLSADRGDYRLALQICDAVTQSSDAVAMTWRDYCRMAAVYALAYEHDVLTEASMASAAKCLTNARELAPDSVSVYLNSMPREYSAALNTVMQTVDGLSTDHSTLGDHEEGDFLEPDSIPHEHA